jgi:hypothetical protein
MFTFVGTNPPRYYQANRWAGLSQLMGKSSMGLVQLNELL